MTLEWDAVSTGSIPACAGEPAAHPGAQPGAEVYPRVCGGTEGWHLIQPAAIGLSPRVRGNLGIALAIAYTERSIPACAGEPPAG